MASDDDTQKRSSTDLDDFGKKLDKARESEETRRLWKSNVNRPPSSALGLAFRVSVELVSAVAVGLAIGWGIDWVLGSRPWAMIVFIILGFIAGVMNVYRVASGMSMAKSLGQKDDASDAEKAEQAPEEGKDRRG